MTETASTYNRCIADPVFLPPKTDVPRCSSHSSLRTMPHTCTRSPAVSMRSTNVSESSHSMCFGARSSVRASNSSADFRRFCLLLFFFFLPPSSSSSSGSKSSSSSSSSSNSSSSSSSSSSSELLLIPSPLPKFGSSLSVTRLQSSVVALSKSGVNPFFPRHLGVSQFAGALKFPLLSKVTRIDSLHCSHLKNIDLHSGFVASAFWTTPFNCTTRPSQLDFNSRKSLTLNLLEKLYTWHVTLHSFPMTFRLFRREIISSFSPLASTTPSSAFSLNPLAINRPLSSFGKL